MPETEASARVVAVMNNRRRRYTCVFIAVSGGSVSVSVTDPMPGFMEGVRIRLEPGTYQVCTTLRVAPNSAVFGSAVNLALRRDGSPVATITLRVSNPNDWGLQVDIHPHLALVVSLRGRLRLQRDLGCGGISFWLYDLIVREDLLDVSLP